MISTTYAQSEPLSAEDFQRLAQADLDGLASPADLAILQEHEDEWVFALRALRDNLNDVLDRLQKDVTGPERELVLADFSEERRRVEIMLAQLTGEPLPTRADRPPAVDVLPAAPPLGEPHLQLTWSRGRVVAWSASAVADPERVDDVLDRLRAAGAPAEPWQAHAPVVLPGDEKADTVAAPVAAVLGWLVGLGSSEQDDAGHGPSVTWFGLVAALAVRLVAQGRMVPQLDRISRGDGQSGNGSGSSFAVRWMPALVDADELSSLADAMPRAVAALDDQKPRDVTQALLAGCVDAICRDAASRIEVPAPPPRPRSGQEVAETFLARLDGTPFDAPDQHGTGLGHGLRRWAQSALGASHLRLVVQLDPPDDVGAWHLKTLAKTDKGKLERVEPAMSKSSRSRREAIKSELDRLEALYAPLAADRSKHRGEVILSQEEAWELMTSTGPNLIAAGYDVRVPPLSRRKPSPSLRVTSTRSGETAVGARELTDVRWAAVFGDAELTAEDIVRLSQESRPLVQAHGRWVEVDHADLEAAAAALAERERDTRLTGADMLRYALGLESGPLAGGIAVDGEGWATDLLRSARDVPEDPPTQPEGFVGELRTYQADALAWLEFLDSAGLGGCLALDMGLGKTPVMLAHLRRTMDRGPGLVIAPPAVVGNWASEAARFVPDLKVVVHHGTDRADPEEVAAEVADADLIITTYATGVRDIDALEDIAWDKVVLDEAQVIKNHTTDTAQQLRRLDAHMRVVLTGTPIENGLGDLWSLMDFVNPGLLGDRSSFIAQMSEGGGDGDGAERVLRTLNGVLVFRRTKAEPAIAEELPDRIDELDHCPMTPEQIGLYQAVLDELVVAGGGDGDGSKKKGAVLAAITALKQICNHPEAYVKEGGPLKGRSGKLERLEEIVDNVFEAGERMLIFTHFATWGEKLATYLSERTGISIDCYHGGLARGARDKMVRKFQEGEGPGALVLSLKAGGTGLNLTAASHVVLYDRWWNPAVEDQARDRTWRIGQTKTVVCHRLVCPGTVDERVEEVVAGKRRIADMVLPKSSSIGDLDGDQLQRALGIDPDLVLTHEAAATDEKARA